MIKELLRTIALALNDAGIPYMVIGGQAVLVHGEARFTRDIDVTIALIPSQIDQLARLLPEAGLRADVDDPVSFVKRTMVLPCRHEVSHIPVDFVFADTPYEHQALQRAPAVPIEGTDVRFAAVEDLVIHKIIADRARDLEDVRGILLKNPDADLANIRQWLDQFTQVLEKPLRQGFDDLLAELAD